MPIKATRLRQNLYHILDDVLDTGVPVEIERKGKILKIVTNQAIKLDNLEKHDVLKVDAEEIVHLDWSQEWSGGGE